MLSDLSYRTPALLCFPLLYYFLNIFARLTLISVSLDEVGKEIWLKILEVDTLTKLIEYFQSKYDISEHVKIANDIQELYNLLVSTEILCIDEQEI